MATNVHLHAQHLRNWAWECGSLALALGNRSGGPCTREGRKEEGKQVSLSMGGGRGRLAELPHSLLAVDFSVH